MLIKASQIIGCKAVSRSGYYLGRVTELEVDSLTQNIAKYYVSDGLLPVLRKPALIIDAQQVIEIKEKEIVVEDATIPLKALKKKEEAGMGYAK